MRKLTLSRRETTLAALGALSLVSVGFWVAGAIGNRSFGYWYLIWNLFLAWVPLLLVAWLIKVLNKRPWLNWRPAVLSVLWLSFLPNSFYLVTDFVHLQYTVRLDVLFDAIMLETFVVNGLLLGYLSILLVHLELLKRISSRAAAWLIGLTILICSFAVYIGRDLRLSSWDILISPASVLFSVADTFLHPASHAQAFTLTLSAFVFLGSIYLVAWRLIKLFHQKLT